MQTACTDLALLALVFLGEGVQMEPTAKFPGHNVQTVPSLENFGNLQRCGERLRASGLHLPNLSFSLSHLKHPLLPRLVQNFQGGNSKLKSQHQPCPAAPGHHQTPICYRSHSGLHLHQISIGRWASYFKDSTRPIG